MHGFVEVAECRRQAPCAKRWSPAAQTRQSQLDLHTSLRRKQLMPFVADDRSEIAKLMLGIGTRQHQRQTFRGCHQRGRQSLALLVAHSGRSITRSTFDGPADPQTSQRFLQRMQGIDRECSQGRDPQDLQRRIRDGGRILFRLGQRLNHRTQPGRQSLSCARRRVD